MLPVAALSVALASVAVACSADVEVELIGQVPDEPVTVDHVALPELTANGRPFHLRASDDGVLVVYFGFANCPDVCPTTLHDLRVALASVDETERVSVAMVTVDPFHDLAVLPDYLHSFVPGGHALGTDDDVLLAAAAEPFGVTYDIVIDEGRYMVGHTPDLFVVDEAGEIVVVWPFATPSDDMAADLTILLG